MNGVSHYIPLRGEERSPDACGEAGSDPKSLPGT